MSEFRKSRKKVELAFDEWMRRYTQVPEDFEVGWRSVLDFLQQDDTDSGPEYGRACVEYLLRILDEMG